MFDINIRIGNNGRTILLLPIGNFKITQYDNLGQRLVFQRPPEFNDSDLVLLFNDSVLDFEPQNIRDKNEFEITDALTYYDRLYLQVYFVKNSVQTLHSNIVSFPIRPSLERGEKSTSTLPSEAEQIRVEFDGLFDKLDADKVQVQNEIAGLFSQLDDDRQQVQTEIAGLFNEVGVEREQVRDEIAGLFDQLDADKGQVQTEIAGLFVQLDADKEQVRDEVAGLFGQLDADRVQMEQRFSELSGEVRELRDNVNSAAEFAISSANSADTAAANANAATSYANEAGEFAISSAGQVWEIVGNLNSVLDSINREVV